MVKTCTKCGETKPLEDFHRQKSGKYGRQPKCKNCQKAYNKEYYNKNQTELVEKKKEYRELYLHKVKESNLKYDRKNRKKRRESSKQWRILNPEKYSSAQRLWRDNNREHLSLKQKEYSKEKPEVGKTAREKYRENNKDKFAHYSAKRRATKLQATPPWITEEQSKDIENFYSLSRKLSKLTGEPMEVDHIVPLQGENVCGLHVPWNLQVLHMKLNRTKGNRTKNDSLRI